MAKKWEQCPRRDKAGRWATLAISMNQRGHIKFTRYTNERLNMPEAFLLLYDRTNNTIGLKQAYNSTKDSFPNAPRGRFGGRVVRAHQLCQEFGIQLPGNMRFVAPEIDEDGILNLDLRTARPAPRVVTKGKK